MEGMINPSSSSPLQDGHSHSHSQLQSYDAAPTATTHDDFLEQMLSTIPNCSSWPDLSNNPNNNNNNNHKSPSSDDHQTLPPTSGNPDAVHFPFDDSVMASKLRQHQMNGNNSSAAAAAAVKSFLLQEQLMMPRGGGLRSPSGGDGGGDGETGGLLPHLNPLTLGGGASGDSVDSRLLLARSHSEVAAAQGGHGSVQALFNGFGGGGSLHGNNGQNPNQQQQQQFHHSPQNFGSQGGAAAAAAAAMNPTPGSASSGGGGSGQAPQRQRVRARRGQATDPHSIAERLRRERIAERMKALQELVPNANKTDKASMLDEIIDYVKFLQLQVKVLSMSRLGGAGAVNPLVADHMSSEGGGATRTANGNQAAASNNNDNTMTVTEHQVAKLMKEDMGSAMQYLQGKGLCLMPISLATAISTATCHPRNSSSLSSSSAAAAAMAAAAASVGGVGNPLTNGIMNGVNAANFNHQNGSNNNPLMVAASNGEGAPTSPNMSVLTAQSGGAAAAADGSAKDANSQ